MPGNVEPDGAAQSDIQDLNTPANGENRQPARDRLRNRLELPAVALWIKIIFVDQGRIDIFLAQKFGGDVRAACQEQSVHLVHRNIAFARIENMDVRMLRKKWSKPFFVFRAHPGGKIGHKGMTNDEGMTKFKLALPRYALLVASSLVILSTFELRHSNGSQGRAYSPISSRTYFAGGLPYEITWSLYFLRSKFGFFSAAARKSRCSVAPTK